MAEGGYIKHATAIVESQRVGAGTRVWAFAHILPGAGEDYVAHLYVLRSRARDQVRTMLKSRGIATDIHYPVPDHLQDAARATQPEARLPATEQAAREVLTLPCYPELEASEVAAVATALEALAQEARVG